MSGNMLINEHAVERVLNHFGETTMIGDRMDTDIIAGIESGLDTVLVLSGVTTLEGAERNTLTVRGWFYKASEISWSSIKL